VKLTHPLLTFLGKVLPGQSAGTLDEATIEIQSRLALVLELPTPMLYGTFAADGATYRSSFCMSDILAINSNIPGTFFVLEAGLWDIEINAQVIKTGGVDDVASTFTMTQSVGNITNGVSQFARFTNTSVINQIIYRRFRLAVHKDHPITFAYTRGIGGAVGTQTAHVHFHCNRLL